VTTRPVTKLRISIVQYLNTAPLVRGFTNGPLRGKYDLSFTVPSQCAEQLRTGQADVAIIPAIEYARIPDLEILPDLSVASKKMVRSLLLVSKAPIGQFKSVALDSSSRSTQALTRILCTEHWKITPEFIEMPPDLETMLKMADAALLIGDPALRLSLTMEPYSTRIELHGSQKTPHKPLIDGWMWNAEKAGIASPAQRLFVFDMVEQWRAMTGLPAVLAVWAARKGVATPEVVADFHASRDFGMSHISEISSNAARELELPADKLESYLRDNIDFSLDEENRCGLELYFAHAAKLGLIPQAKPIDWASADVVGAAFRGGPTNL
jgi:chorismate dehydratase